MNMPNWGRRCIRRYILTNKSSVSKGPTLCNPEFDVGVVPEFMLTYFGGDRANAGDKLWSLNRAGDVCFDWGISLDHFELHIFLHLFFLLDLDFPPLLIEGWIIYSQGLAYQTSLARSKVHKQFTNLWVPSPMYVTRMMRNRYLPINTSLSTYSRVFFFLAHPLLRN